MANRDRRGAFALVDLLALSVLVGAFALIAAGALKRAAGKDLGSRCAANQRELIVAWTLYAADDDGTLCNNFTIPDTLSSITTGKFETWANNVMTWSASGSMESSSCTNIDWALRSPLAPYSNHALRMMKCPADRYLSPAQRAAGWKARLRSYSMNAFVGSTGSSSVSGRSWAEGGAYRQFLRTSDIPDPEMTWVTIEEHPDSINDGFFVNAFTSSAWGDIPATLHSGETSFSFADGHVELRKWRSSTWRVPVAYRYSFVRPFDSLGRQDFVWYRDRVGYVRYP